MTTTELNLDKYTIGSAQKSHENDIKNFLKENWRSLQFGEAFIEKYLPSSLDLFWNNARSYFQILTVDMAIKSTISFCPLFPRPDTEVCFLKNFYVHEDMRGMGIGKSMLSACLLKAYEMRYSMVYLETKRSFESAIYLYKKYGFRRIPGPVFITEYPSDVFMLANVKDVINNIERELNEYKYL